MQIAKYNEHIVVFAPGKPVTPEKQQDSYMFWKEKLPYHESCSGHLCCNLETLMDPVQTKGVASSWVHWTSLAVMGVLWIGPQYDGATWVVVRVVSGWVSCGLGPGWRWGLWWWWGLYLELMNTLARFLTMRYWFSTRPTMQVPMIIQSLAIRLYSRMQSLKDLGNPRTTLTTSLISRPHHHPSAITSH